MTLSTAAHAVKVHTIGDSTMALWTDGNHFGWGQVFQQFFDETVTVNNRGKNSRSSKSFYNENGLWPTVKPMIQAGDYVIIQFGHNDEKAFGLDGEELNAYYEANEPAKVNTGYDRGTSPKVYAEYLKKYINEVRAAGATPILATSICWPQFDGNTISRYGRHDLGGSFYKFDTDGKLLTGQTVADDSYDYCAKMKQVAAETGVKLIDLTTMTKNLFESYGPTQVLNELFATGDKVHTNEIGATKVAYYVAEQLKANGILADHITLENNFNITPGNIDFGFINVGSTSTKELKIMGVGLTPASGEISISSTSDLLFSADGKTFSKSLSLKYTDGDINTKFFVRCGISVLGDINEKVIVENGGKKVEVSVGGRVIDRSQGVETTVHWALSEATKDACEIDNNVISAKESWQDIELRGGGYYIGVNWPAETGRDKSTYKTQCFRVNGDKGWPLNEYDVIEGRYVEFAITPTEANTTFNIDKISLLAGTYRNTIAYEVQYSKEENFANSVMLYRNDKAKASTMESIEKAVAIELKTGETLRLRFLPWNTKDAEDNQFVYLSDVKISGLAVTGTQNGICDIMADAGTKADGAIFNLAGQRVDANYKGIVIKNGRKYLAK